MVVLVINFNLARNFRLSTNTRYYYLRVQIYVTRREYHKIVVKLISSYVYISDTKRSLQGQCIVTIGLPIQNQLIKYMASWNADDKLNMFEVYRTPFLILVQYCL